jgi:hypothetical protein
MLLIDVSSSTLINLQKGVKGADGPTVTHDQPPTIRSFEHLVHRALHHMIPRSTRNRPPQDGIPPVLSIGTYVGELSTKGSTGNWQSKVLSCIDGSTQLLAGIKHQQATSRFGLYDEVIGWQPTLWMPILSLLVFPNGEADDLDEFELEMFDATWVYVTVVLVRHENDLF